VAGGWDFVRLSTISDDSESEGSSAELTLNQQAVRDGVAKSRDSAASWSFLTVRVRRRLEHFLYSHRNGLYLAYEESIMSLFPGRSLRILVSDREWDDCTRDEIRKGFSHSSHKVEFGPIAPESLAQYDLVVPLSFSDLAPFRQSESLAKNPIPVPSEASIAICEDKLKFGRTLIEMGFDCHVPFMDSVVAPPYFLKGRIGSWGKECWLVLDCEDEKRVLDKLDNPEFFRQQVIPGNREFATHILFADNRIVRSLNIMYEFDTEIPIKGQDHWRYRIIHRCPYLKLFARILSSIGYQGLCCVNYKVVRGKLYLLEINPRFGGSLAPYLFSFIRSLPIS
jgi:hypothetical protein